jgi:hypothetical protein
MVIYIMLTIGMEIPDEIKHMMIISKSRLFIRLGLSDDVKDTGINKIVRVEYCDEKGRTLHIKENISRLWDEKVFAPLR